MADATTAAEALVPHRGPALLLRRIVEWEPNRIVCVGTIPEDSPFVEGGRAPSLVGIELGAQAAAALEGVQRPTGEGGPPRPPGYLVGVSEARFAQSWLPASHELRVVARRVGGAGPLVLHEVRVEAEGRLCLVATISTYAR